VAKNFLFAIQNNSEKRGTTPAWDFPYDSKVKRDLPFSILGVAPVVEKAYGTKP
jgi:hypothetical protein